MTSDATPRVKANDRERRAQARADFAMLLAT
jgi:hypothetical protein